MKWKSSVGGRKEELQKTVCVIMSFMWREKEEWSESREITSLNINNKPSQHKKGKEELKWSNERGQKEGKGQHTTQMTSIHSHTYTCTYWSCLHYCRIHTHTHTHVTIQATSHVHLCKSALGWQSERAAQSMWQRHTQPHSVRWREHSRCTTTGALTAVRPNPQVVLTFQLFTSAVFVFIILARPVSQSTFCSF